MQARNPPKTSARDARIRGKSLPTYNSITQILPRAVARGLLFYSLLSVRCTNLYWLPIIWITHLHYPVQLDYANTHPFRYRGVTFLLSLIRPLYKSLLASYYLDYPFQPDYANPPVQMRGNFVYFFLLPQEYFIYFFTSIIRRLLGISDHINCPKQFSSVNALPYRV